MKEILATEVTESIEKGFSNKILKTSVFSVAKKVPNSVGEVAEWTKAADCKSAGASLRRFESCPPQNNCELNIKAFATEVTEKIEKDFLNKFFLNSVFSVAKYKAGVAQLARASAFQAEGRGFESRLPLSCCQAHVAQAVEHILGKDVVGGSSPPVGSKMVARFGCGSQSRR